VGLLVCHHGLDPAGPRPTPLVLLFAVCLLFGATFVLTAPGFAQDATAKRGSVKGRVSLINASQERSAAEGLLLELKPLASAASSITVATDAAGNYEFKDVGRRRLRSSAQLPRASSLSKATLHVQSGLPIVQDISLKLTGRHRESGSEGASGAAVNHFFQRSKAQRKTARKFAAYRRKLQSGPASYAGSCAHSRTES